MPGIKKGSRVGAILSSTPQKVRFLGFGTYVGNEDAPIGTNPGLEALHKAIGEGPRLKNNPKIELDNGDTVWGCQCWWGSEEDIKEAIEGKEIHHVRIVMDDDGCWSGRKVEVESITMPPDQNEDDTEDDTSTDT